jgi:glycosyltransferase involved in cell wall biosynthesis
VFNAESTVTDAVLSAASQSLKPCEIIIVDDFSTDSSLKRIKSLTDTCKLIRVIQNTENIGVAACRNIIVNQAKGDYIAFFDDDDVSDPERLRKQYKRISEYKKTYFVNTPVICHSARIQKFSDGSEKYIPTMGVNLKKTAPQGARVAERILTGKPLSGANGACATCSQMGVTSDYRTLNGFDESFRRSEDTEYNIRFALSGGHFIGVKEPLVIQTMTLTTDKCLKSELELSIMFLKKHREFIDKYSSYDFCKEWIEIKYLYLSGKNEQFILRFLKLFLLRPTYVLKRIIWGLPNFFQNHRFKSFHSEEVIAEWK